MAFETQVALTTNQLLRKRIRLASIIAALQVQGEAQGGTPEGAFVKRQVLATKVIQTAGLGTPTEDLAMMFVWLVVANEAISDASSDSDIQFTVNSVWSDAAGVTGTET